MTASEAVATAAGSRSRARLHTIHRTLRERICLLHYRPGHALSESAVAEEFGVSRTPIRRVLGRLESEGLVERRHGVGTIVTTIEFDRLVDVYALRMRLAELMGEMDPLPRTAEDVAFLRGLHARILALAERRDEEAFARLNMEYTLALIAGVGNQALHDTMERLFFQTARIWVQAVGRMDWPSEATIFARELEDVIGAMRLGDLRAVGLIHRNHISMSLLRLSRHLGRREPPAAARDG